MKLEAEMVLTQLSHESRDDFQSYSAEVTLEMLIQSGSMLRHGRLVITCSPELLPAFQEILHSRKILVMTIEPKKDWKDIDGKVTEPLALEGGK